ncbi:MAG: M16 family metallopeptidase [Flavobacteriales bacterium]
MKTKITYLLIVGAIVLIILNINKKMNSYSYESAKNDPTNSRVYTLDNGLKVYLTTYKDAPRIQTYIAVNAGSKNDPSDATGLAHYLEHMLFKGTDKFGTLDYQKEKVLLDKIENLYEEYRQTSMDDNIKRDKIWAQIDSISGEAAKFAIANEYDKMASGIGAKGTNAYTSAESTVYLNDIPSNQIKNWLDLESERFRNPVFRLFHTELEAVYEEKNIALDSDGRKMFEALLSGLYQNHTYGTQTTIGTIDHLKNPSLKEIRKYFNKNYVPNNMAICMSGDFNPDSVIVWIDNTFGKFERKEDPVFVPGVEKEITEPIIKEVYGPDAERLYMGYRFPGASDRETKVLSVIDMILSNSQAGLIDLNLNQKQKVLQASCFPYILKDYSSHILFGVPKQNQSLEEVKDLILEQIELVKKGEFPDWLIPAIINDLKLSKIKKLEKNSSRADEFVQSFILGIDWQTYVNQISVLESITKDEVIEVANKYYKNNYVLVNKNYGEDLSVRKVTKPTITPVEVNPNAKSEFLTNLLDKEVENIEPDFLNYSTDVKTAQVNNVSLSYLQNNENDRFKLYYISDRGTNHDPMLKMAIEYLNYLGTDKISPSQKKEEFYKLGCDVSVNIQNEQSFISLTGLNENFTTSVELFENLLANIVPNETALNNLKSDLVKKRSDDKLNKSVILQKGMVNFAKYGAKNPFTTTLSNEEIEEVTSEELIAILKQLTSYQHRILYYGPEKLEIVTNLLTEFHKTPDQLIQIEDNNNFEELDINSTNVYIVDYDMKQVEILMVAKGEKFQAEKMPLIKLHNEYFGGSMGSIVFQTLRESKALAYSVYSAYSTPREKDKSHFVTAYIGAQSDKLEEAMFGMNELLDEVPQLPSNLENAKEAVIQKIRTERITKDNILFNYESAKKLGYNYDMRKDIFENINSYSMDDISNFHNQYMSGNDYTILVLGNKDELDLDALKKHGPVKFLTLEDIFGY